MPRRFRVPFAVLRLLCLVIGLQAIGSGQIVYLNPSSVTLTASPNPSNYGQAVTLTATVTSGATGKVTFYDGTTILGVGAISGTQATLTTVMLASGSRSLRAYYQGDSSYGPSSSTPLPQSVVAGASLGLRRAVSYSTSAEFASMAVGDFNGDGKQDLVAGRLDMAAVSVFLGNGDGTFQAGVNYSIGTFGGSPAVSDVNGDGKPDLIVGAGTDVSVLLGNGDGTFQAAVSFPTAAAANYAVAVGDFNSDGKADVVSVNTGGSSVSVLLGNGNGMFGAATTYSVGASPESVAVGDLNGDGIADIAVGTYYGVSVLLGKGDGTFMAAVNYTVGSYGGGVAVSDVNGDGKADIVLADSSGASVLLGNGDGTFGAAASYSAGSNPYATAVAVEDFNGDGKPDLALASINYNAVNVLTGNGDGSFQAAMSYTVVSGFVALAVGDFNGDGKPDLVAASRSSGLSVLLGGAIPDLTIAATHRAGFTQGQVGAAYATTVTNIGGIATSGAVGVVAALPSVFTATSLGGGGWTCDLATLACVRSDSLAVGASYPAITARVNVAGGPTGNATTTFTVSGGGDQNPANNSVSDTAFVRSATVTTLASSPNPAVLGQVVTLTATVTAGATGSVTFYAGTAVLGVAAMAGGQAVFTTGLLPSGATSLHAEYDGDSHYGPSVSAMRTHTITPVIENGLQPATGYKVDVEPEVIVAGDFNGDGKIDLVTANYGSAGAGSISVLMGNGDGTFRSAVNYADGEATPDSVVVGDFNGDGKADVAIVGNNGIYLLLGNGDGTFQTALAISLSSYGSLRSADFNGDGKPDLAAMSNGCVVIFLGNGDGTFQPPVTVTATGTYFGSLAVADMNGDGKADLIVLNEGYGGGPSVLLGNGDGTFQPAVTGPGTGSTYPMSFAVGDFNGDGRTDVAIIYSVGVQVMLGNGDGSLQAPIQTSLSFTPGYFAIAGDFNGDGKLDLAYSRYGTGGAYLALGNGDGTFQYNGWQNGIALSAFANPGQVVLADFNGDGKPDVATFSVSANMVQIILGGQFSGLSISATHAGNFIAGQTGVYQIAIGNPAFTITSGTVTVTDTLPAGLTPTAISGSGWTCTLSTLACTRSDALNNELSYPSITIAVNVSGSLSPSTITNRASVSNSGIINTATDPTVIVLPTTTTLAVSPNPSSLGQTVTLTASVTAGAAGTVVFSADGMQLGSAALSSGHAGFSTGLLPAGLHSLTATYSGDSTHAPSASTIMAQTVNAAAASGLIAGGNYATGAGPWAIAAADFNRDGRTDLVTANSTANTVSVLLGNGDGTFGANKDYDVGTKPVAVAVGDFNNDGKTDIAVANQISNNVSVLLGNGDGTFQAAIDYATGNGPVSLGVGDFNNDGRADLVVANGSAGTLTLLFGNGDGTFQPAATISSGELYALAIGDFNRDGKADIAEANWGVYVLLGNGNGTFQSALSYAPYYSPALSVGDLNADGKEDIVMADETSGVDALLGNGDGTFQPYVHYATGAQAAWVGFADVNGDGKLDVVAVNNANSTISVLFGNGDGTLQAAISYTVGSSPRAAVAGDFNGDGRTDLAIANSGSNSVTVLLGILTPVLSVIGSHASPFAAGQVGAAYSIAVVNHGPGITSGTVTVTDTLPAGLTATAISGTGWSCTLATLTCTRSDSLAASASYPPITVTVNVAANATAPLVNAVYVSGGGSPDSSSSDPTTIAMPSVVSVSPSAGSGWSQTFTFTLSDTAGAAAINEVYVMVNGAFSSASGCFFEYYHAANTFWLSNDADTAWQGSTAVGSGAAVSNSQCTLNGAGASVSGSGNQLTVSVPVTFQAAFAGAKNVYVYVDDNANLNSGWQTAGTWTVPSGSAPPSVVSVSPSSGSGLSQTFTFTLSDAAGAAAINDVYVLVNGAFSSASGCFFEYYRPANTFWLSNDADTA